MVPERSWRLEANAEAPWRARRWLYQALQLWDLDDPDSCADVLTSELVTNVVRHADSEELVLHLVAEVGRLRVEVEDDGTGVVELRHNNPASGSGYGLQLVDQLADAWGCEPTGTGKRVWFELRLR